MRVPGTPVGGDSIIATSAVPAMTVIRTSKLEILMAKSKARAATTVAALSLATLAAAPTACGCRRLCD
ncbi:hypothetical protein ACKAMS_10700 [Rhodococcus sp. 5A-K4]|uniref:hypothetical protein n=1 Tax=Rhodococcus sp. 5A-K4 TaxID=3384442 RepID=UPI0038D3FB1F